MQSDAQNIPFQIVVCEILRRIPVQSLLRFRCVCRSWCEAISDPKLSLSTHRLAVLTKPTSVDHFTLSIMDYSSSSSLEVTSMCSWKKPEFFSLDDLDNDVRLLCCYNGLLLLKSGDSVVLLNPSIRRCEKVYRYVDDVNYVFTGAVCYHPVTNIFKILIGIMDSSDPFRVPKLIVIDYKTKKRKEFVFPYDYWYDSCLVVHGNPHWLITDVIVPKLMQKVVCFDTVKDELITLQVPDPKYGNKQNFIDLMVLDGCLGIARSCGCETGSYNIDILLMKQYGVKESWEILYTIADFNGYNPRWQLKPFLVKDGEVLMIANDSHILAYDTKEKSYRDICPSQQGIAYAVSYVESMFWPDASEEGSKFSRFKMW